MERMAGHLLTLLEAFAADPQVPVSRLGMLTAAERGQLASWNATEVPLPSASGVHELVAAAAARYPDAVAVSAPDGQLTYAGLVERAGRLASVLSAAGAGPETVVALCLPRGLDMVTAVLATWWCGAAYLPLDPDYPLARLEYMLADSGAGVLVTVGDPPPGLPAGDWPVIRLDDPGVKQALRAASPAAPARAHHDQLAYVIYTSGSTGTPKGVLATHGGAVNLVTALGEVLGAVPGRRVLQFCSFSFDGSVGELLVAPATGGTLVMADSDERLEPSLLTRLIRKAGVEIVSLTAALLGIMQPRDLVGVRTLMSAGERLEPALAAAWREPSPATERLRADGDHRDVLHSRDSPSRAAGGPDRFAGGQCPGARA